MNGNERMKNFNLGDIIGMPDIEIQDLLEILYIRDKGFILFKTKNEVYLCDSRTHKFSVLFPFFTTLKSYTITNKSENAEYKGKEESKREEKDKKNNVSLWGIYGIGMVVASYFEKIDINNNVRFINKIAILASAVIIVLAKYYYHLRNLRQFEKDNDIDLSNTEIKRIKIRYRDNWTQNKYFWFVLFGNSILFLAVFIMGLLSYFLGNPLFTLVFFLVVWFYIFSATSPKTIDGEKYLIIK